MRAAAQWPARLAHPVVALAPRPSIRSLRRSVMGGAGAAIGTGLMRLRATLIAWFRSLWRGHEDFRACSAALESSTENDDSVLAVPGPGSKSNSVRVCPRPSMT